MSADPPRKAYKYTCNMVRPQIYSEKSLMESVVDFFSDVVPQAYSGTQKCEDKEKIQWVRFENCDCNDVAKNPDVFRSDTKGLPLLLILGYSNGVQIWQITANGEAQEVLSLRQGPVRICRLIPNPDPVLGAADSYTSKRPLMVMCDSSSAGQPYCGVKFVSLKTGDEVHSISFKTLPVQNIECNKRFIALVFLEKIVVHEACNFKQLFWVTSCFPCPGLNANPISLSTRWLAYADKRLVPMHQSCGGMSGDGAQSYAATVISAAKGAFRGLSMFGEAMVNSVTGCKGPQPRQNCVQLDNGNRPGIVSVIDIQNIHNDHFNVNEDNDGDGLIAHFHAHANEPVSHMAFDPTGTLLVTACKLGHNFHVFRLMAHPVSSSLGAVHHLYTLHRGETTAKVIDISFSSDSRWVTVSSHRGTTHLFPITPYGGPVTVRTHCQTHVVNRASRFHRSAGLDEFEHVGRRSPILSTSPSSSGQYDRYPTLIQQNTLNNNMGNPRLPPYPHPTTIPPAFQIKQPLNYVLNPGNKNQSPIHSPPGLDNVYSVCAKFCLPRLCVVGSPKLDMERRDAGKKPVDSLFVMAQSGILVEYVLEPRAKTVSDKVTDECRLELGVTGRMQWNLQRLKNSQELRPPLPSNSPLILAHEAVVSQVPTAPDLYDLPGLTRQDSRDSLSSDHSNKDDGDEQWVAHVEIITHEGPHRRLWMGPQFSFKTYQENTTVLCSNSSSLLSQSPESNMAAMDMAGDEGDLESLKLQPTRSNPVTMPNARPAYRRLSGSDSSPSPGGQCTGAQAGPLLIEAGSFDQSPHLLDVYSNWTESTVAKQPRGSVDLEEDRLKETLADAMVESPIKDIEKLSLRQDIPRTSVKRESARSEPRSNTKASRDETKEKLKEKMKGGSAKEKKENRKEEVLATAEKEQPKEEKLQANSDKPKLSHSSKTFDQSSDKNDASDKVKKDSSVKVGSAVQNKNGNGKSKKKKNRQEVSEEAKANFESTNKEVIGETDKQAKTSEGDSVSVANNDAKKTSSGKKGSRKSLEREFKQEQSNEKESVITESKITERKSEQDITDSPLESSSFDKSGRFDIGQKPGEIYQNETDSAKLTAIKMKLETEEHMPVELGTCTKDSKPVFKNDHADDCMGANLENNASYTCPLTFESSVAADLSETNEEFLVTNACLMTDSVSVSQSCARNEKNSEKTNGKKGKNRKKGKKQNSDGKSLSPVLQSENVMESTRNGMETTEKIKNEVERSGSSSPIENIDSKVSRNEDECLKSEVKQENEEMAAGSKTEIKQSLTNETGNEYTVYEVETLQTSSGIVSNGKSEPTKSESPDMSQVTEEDTFEVRDEEFAEVKIKKKKKGNKKQNSTQSNETKVSEIKIELKVTNSANIEDKQILEKKECHIESVNLPEDSVTESEGSKQKEDAGGEHNIEGNSESDIEVVEEISDKQIILVPQEMICESSISSSVAANIKADCIEKQVPDCSEPVKEENDEITEVKSKRRKKKKKNNMEESVYEDNKSSKTDDKFDENTEKELVKESEALPMTVSKESESSDKIPEEVSTEIREEQENENGKIDLSIKHNFDLEQVTVTEDFPELTSNSHTDNTENQQNDLPAEEAEEDFVVKKKKNRKKKKAEESQKELDIIAMSACGNSVVEENPVKKPEFENVTDGSNELCRADMEKNTKHEKQMHEECKVTEVNDKTDFPVLDMSDSLDKEENFEEARDDGKNFDSEGDSRYETADDDPAAWERAGASGSSSVSKSNSESSDLGRVLRNASNGSRAQGSDSLDNTDDVNDIDSEMSKMTLVSASRTEEKVTADDANVVSDHSEVLSAQAMASNYTESSSGSNRSSEEKELDDGQKKEMKKQETKPKKKKKKNRK